MAEIQRGPQDKELWRAGAQVKTVTPESPGNEYFRVSVELDRAHDAVVLPPDAGKNPGEASRAAADSAPPVTNPPADTKGPVEDSTAAPAAEEAAPPEKQEWSVELSLPIAETPGAQESAEVTPGETPEPATEAADKPETEGELAALAAKASEISLPKLARMIESGVVAEYERRLAELKTTISAEVERAAQEILTARMGRILTAAVETRLAQYQETLPAITDQVVEKLAGRLAKIPQLEASLETLSKGLTERWSEISQKATQAAQENVSRKVGEIETLARQMIGDLEKRLDEHRAEMHGLLEMSQTAIKESATASQRAQETMKRLNEVTEAAAPLMDASLRERFESRSAEFTDKINHIVIERAARFLSDVELLLASRLETAQQAMHDLTQHLQDSEEILRKQEEYLRALVKGTAEQADQEIKGVLRRLAGMDNDT
jgi:hypothetical protein